MSNHMKEISRIISTFSSDENNNDEMESSQFSQRQKLDPLYMSSYPEINKSYLSS